jgi:hypothetical protein
VRHSGNGNGEVADYIRGSKQPLGFQSRDMNVFKGVFEGSRRGRRREEG